MLLFFFLLTFHFSNFFLCLTSELFKSSVDSVSSLFKHWDFLFVRNTIYFLCRFYWTYFPKPSLKQFYLPQLSSSFIRTCWKDAYFSLLSSWVVFIIHLFLNTLRFAWSVCFIFYKPKATLLLVSIVSLMLHFLLPLYFYFYFCFQLAWTTCKIGPIDILLFSFLFLFTFI